MRDKEDDFERLLKLEAAVKRMLTQRGDDICLQNLSESSFLQN